MGRPVARQPDGEIDPGLASWDLQAAALDALVQVKEKWIETTKLTK